MLENLKKLTLVSITFNDEGIIDTLNSIEKYTKLGAIHIIQNGGEPIPITISCDCRIFNEVDAGIYDAINKGIARVTTEYFMLVHAGDKLIAEAKVLNDLIQKMDLNEYVLSLNSQKIGIRLHSSRTWRPYMLHLGVQPPHMPSIFQTKCFSQLTYDLNFPIIADFHYFYSFGQWDRVSNDGELLIEMKSGGKTSGGIISFLRVSREFVRAYRLNGWLMAITRIPFKIIQAVY